jgi:hypothetical protein
MWRCERHGAEQLAHRLAVSVQKDAKLIAKESIAKPNTPARTRSP